MKFLIILILATSLQYSQQSFNPFRRFRTPPRRTTTISPNNVNYCNNRKRTWSFCTGNPPTRFTTDRCARRTERCGTGVALASKFVQSFTAPTQVQSSITGSSSAGSVNSVYNLVGGSYAIAPTNQISCTRGPALAGASWGSCNVPTRTKRQSSETTFDDPNRDIMILLDESGSISEDRFVKVKQIASSIVKLLCRKHDVHPDKSRVGVITFDAEVHPFISLLETNPISIASNTNGDFLATAIMSITYKTASQGRTCLYNALNHAHTQSFSISQGGRRSNDSIVQEIIIITDGCANCGGNLEQMRDTLVNAETSVYVIGVGLTPNCQENIKILAQGGKCNHFFFLDVWGEEFDDFVESIVEQAAIPEDEREWCIGYLFQDIDCV